METLYKILANILFVLHIILGLIFLFGWLYPHYRFLYLILLISWPLSWIVLGYCPLTKWELWFRKRLDPSIDTNREFIQYYALRFLNIRLASRNIYIVGLIVFGILLILSLSRPV